MNRCLAKALRDKEQTHSWPNHNYLFHPIFWIFIIISSLLLFSFTIHVYIHKYYNLFLFLFELYMNWIQSVVPCFFNAVRFILLLSIAKVLGGLFCFVLFFAVKQYIVPQIIENSFCWWTFNLFPLGAIKKTDARIVL